MNTQRGDPSGPPSPQIPNLNLIYSIDRLQSAVNDLDPYKAPGPDGIYPITVKKAMRYTDNLIRKIMKLSHKLNHIPLCWRESRAIFIPKPGKTDYCSPKSFRTITLSPVLLKLQERLVYWNMLNDHKMGDLTSERQFGFRKGVSTETALHKVVHRIERRIAQKGYVLGTFLDIEGAFDNVSFEAISKSLHDSPIDASTAGWITNMVSNRYVTIEHKNVKKRIKVKRGCPQGGVLSPFLWNLIVDDLLKFSANEIPGYLQAFADDLFCLCEGLDLDVIRQRTQRTIDTIEKWCTTKGLNISALKTQIVMFTWKTKWNLPKPIKVSGIPITLSDSARLLGVTLDSKLNFNDHVDNIVRKATASLMQCKRAVGPTWGLTPKTCLWIYTRVVRPMLSYSSVVWINALNKQYNVKKLERVQALALRISSGAMPSTSHEALDHITNTPRIATYLQGEAAKGASRLIANGEWTIEKPQPTKGTILAHSTINNTYLQALNLPSGRQDQVKPIYKLNTNYMLEIPKKEEMVEHRSDIANRINQLAPTTITCYTDGSKTESGTGYGYSITTNNNNIIIYEGSAKLPDHCTVYQAELSGITAAAGILQDHTDNNIIFLTDSLSSIQALNSHTLGSRTAIECHTALTTLGDHNAVTILWIPGHEGHAGNEKADDLAKTGTTSDNICPGHIPQSKIKQSINARVRKLDNTSWTAAGHRHTKLALGHPGCAQHKRTVKQLGRLHTDRRKFRTAIQLITGHAGLNAHLHKMTLSDTNICPCCEYAEETVSHFLGQCPAHSLLRGEILNTFYSSLTDIFVSNSIANIVRFAHATGRFQSEEFTHTSGVT